VQSPGFNYLLPDIRFLQPHLKRIKAMFITHGHLDHIGALKNLIPALGFPPIYAAPFTIAMIKKGLEEAGLKNKVQFFTVNPDAGKMANIGVFKYEFFRVNHTIPDSCGVYIETPSHVSCIWVTTKSSFSLVSTNLLTSQTTRA
jgi:ribonuclease J